MLIRVIITILKMKKNSVEKSFAIGQILSKPGLLNISLPFQSILCIISHRNPNKESSNADIDRSDQWKSYTTDEHNYLFFQLNNIRIERNYFDSMYQFWLKIFQIESHGRCEHRLILMKMKKHLKTFFILLASLFLISSICLLRKYCRKKERFQTTNDLVQYPNFLTT